MKKPNRELIKLISYEDINLLADIITIATNLQFGSEVGDLSAELLINEIHKGKYGNYSGVWVQARNMFIRIAALADADEDADIMLDNRHK